MYRDALVYKMTSKDDDVEGKSAFRVYDLLCKLKELNGLSS